MTDHGGDRIARVLEARGVRFLFTLCGGHISPLLVAAERRGIRVVDVRHEATAVFAADAVARLEGTPGVAAVTAGPGVTNALTPLQNARMAQSPLLLIGGAAPTALRGRGALQDIDALAFLRPVVKQAYRVRRVRDLASLVARALDEAASGVPGPVFLECPVDLLYAEETVRTWYGAGSPEPGGLAARATRAWLQMHVDRLFRGAADSETPPPPRASTIPLAGAADVARAARTLAEAERPLLLVGSQAVLDTPRVDAVAAGLATIGAPVYLSGAARGLLGHEHPNGMRHSRRRALKEADVVLLAGVPCDFRLDYGRHVPRGATLIAANRSRDDLRRNRRPKIELVGDAGRALIDLAARLGGTAGRWGAWIERLREGDAERDREILERAAAPIEPGNPLALCFEIERAAAPDAIFIGDGGDFVASASYVVRPRGPLAWLDPGPFGTLGVGAGFALGAKLCRPQREVWVLFGDGAVGYSLAEFDTFSRHGVAVIGVVGNDAGWTQIARDQVRLLGADTACVLAPTAYHEAATALGATGIAAARGEQFGAALRSATEAARAGRPVLVNAALGRSDFRDGSISI